MDKIIKIIITLITFFVLLPVLAAPDLDDLMPEFAGRGNIMGGAEVCGLKGKEVFYKQTMQLIKESGLSAADQKELVRAFEIEYKDGIDFYRKVGDQGNCEVLEQEIIPMDKEQIKLWKMM